MRNLITVNVCPPPPTKNRPLVITFCLMLLFSLLFIACNGDDTDSNEQNGTGTTGKGTTKTWKTVTNSTFGNYPIDSVAWGKDKFVAVSPNNKMAYSADGVTWTAIENNPFTKGTISVAYGNGKWVATGDARQIAYSTDGITWTAVTNTTLSAPQSDPTGNFNLNTYFRCVAWGKDKFVAGGRRRPDVSNYESKMAYSTDGITWTAVTDTTFGTDTIKSIAYGNGKWVAVSGGKVAYSTDGITWTAVTVSISTIESITYGNGKFVAVGDIRNNTGKSDFAAYSTDGITWMAISANPFGGLYGGYWPVTCINWCNNMFVAGGYNSGKMAYSADGITWTGISDGPFNGWQVNSIAYGANKFVAVGSGGIIAYVADITSVND